MAETCKIEALSEPLDSPLALGAVHNEILMTCGEAIIGIGGFAFNRDTGEPSAFTMDSENHALKARILLYSPELLEERIDNGKRSNRITLFEGTRAEVFQKFGQMAEAANFINYQNLPYVFADIIQASQNSNSVFRTMVEAAGIKYGPELEGLFAPGDGRILLPKDWESSYDINRETKLSYSSEFKSFIPKVFKKNII